MIVNQLKQSLSRGALDLRYRQRSFTSRATPFMFPDTFSVNQQLHSMAAQGQSQVKKSALDLHRQQFWNHLNREEILLHDIYSWQKIAQLEENMTVQKKVQQKKRELKAKSKIVKSALKASGKTPASVSASKMKDEILGKVYEKALLTFCKF